MIDFIEVCNYQTGTKIQAESRNAFILNTCQRTLSIGLSCHPQYQLIKEAHHKDLLANYTASDAYKFLLEIICGLQSKLAGESEIINQFKLAYSQYTSQPNPNTIIMKFMEKLFQDAKFIRKNYLNAIHQESYASLTRSIIRQQSQTKRVLIIGTGKLAEDLAKTLFKRYDNYIIGRNTERLATLSEKFQSKILSWNSHELLQEFPVIVNTVSAPLTFLNETFFIKWKQVQTKPLFIDLTSPCLLPNLIKSHPHIFTLDDIFKISKKENQEKQMIISQALLEIDKIVEKRKYTFTYQNHNNWEELAIC